MKNLLALLFEKVMRRTHATQWVHDDTLRANQGQQEAPAFSFWRALVS
jgi:hypothetical protein